MFQKMLTTQLYALEFEQFGNKHCDENLGPPDQEKPIGHSSNRWRRKEKLPELKHANTFWTWGLCKV